MADLDQPPIEDCQPSNSQFTLPRLSQPEVEEPDAQAPSQSLEARRRMFVLDDLPPCSYVEQAELDSLVGERPATLEFVSRIFDPVDGELIDRTKYNENTRIDHTRRFESLPPDSSTQNSKKTCHESNSIHPPSESSQTCSQKDPIPRIPSPGSSGNFSSQPPSSPHPFLGKRLETISRSVFKTEPKSPSPTPLIPTREDSHQIPPITSSTDPSSKNNERSLTQQLKPARGKKRTRETESGTPPRPRKVAKLYSQTQTTSTTSPSQDEKPIINHPTKTQAKTVQRKSKTKRNIKSTTEPKVSQSKRKTKTISKSSAQPEITSQTQIKKEKSDDQSLFQPKTSQSKTKSKRSNKASTQLDTSTSQSKTKTTQNNKSLSQLETSRSQSKTKTKKSNKPLNETKTSQSKPRTKKSDKTKSCSTPNNSQNLSISSQDISSSLPIPTTRFSLRLRLNRLKSQSQESFSNKK